MPEDAIAAQKHDPQPAGRLAANSTSKDELQLEQLRLTNNKLSLEAQKLAREAVPERWWSNLAKNIVAVGGVLTVAATAYGLYDSYNKTLTARLSAQVTEQRTQFEDAIKKLESNNTVSKLVAVSILSGYLGEKDRSFHRQILFTFAGVAATESDPQTQAAILDLLTAQEPAAITANDWSYFQDMLVSQSRALVSKGNLYDERQFGIKNVIPSKDEQAARHVGRLIALLVRKGVVPDYSNYRGIYCEKCNFRDTKFPKNADFVTAVLDRADFRGSSLEGASFDNAALDGTIFARAYMKDAKFRTLAENHLADGRSTTAAEAMTNRLLTPRLQQIQLLLQSQASISLTMPDFSCSNLQNAAFDNFALFNIPDNVKRSFTRGDEANGGW
jgi:Pentapeptide repeats (8 copies)